MTGLNATRPTRGAHLPAEAVTIGTQRRQVCAWCGVLLEDISLLHTYMSDDSEIPTYDTAQWYAFSGPAVWMAAPADEPPEIACCREPASPSHLPEEGDHA